MIIIIKFFLTVPYISKSPNMIAKAAITSGEILRGMWLVMMTGKKISRTIKPRQTALMVKIFSKQNPINKQLIQ